MVGSVSTILIQHAVRPEFIVVVQQQYLQNSALFFFFFKSSYKLIFSL